jgi:hypothetical protein
VVSALRLDVPEIDPPALQRVLGTHRARDTVRHSLSGAVFACAANGSTRIKAQSVLSRQPNKNGHKKLLKQ